MIDVTPALLGISQGVREGRIELLSHKLGGTLSRARLTLNLRYKEGPREVCVQFDVPWRTLDETGLTEALSLNDPVEA